jgi:putative spermidine/putrescine transport system ATP-binding protein
MADRVVVMRDGVIRQVGTPEELYEKPAHQDVADFMGFRNRLPGRVVGLLDGRAEVEVAGTRLSGAAREDVKAGAPVVVSIRPEDLVASPSANGLAARVTALEYRGRAFFGNAMAADGTELFFRSDRAIEKGEEIRLTAEPSRTLVFAGAAA